MDRIQGFSSFPQANFFPEALASPIDNPDAQLICSGNHSFASLLWKQICLFDSAASPETIVEKILKQDQLIERRVEALDQSALCRLYDLMNCEPNQEKRHDVLLAFFSDCDGNLFNIDWLLEGFY